MPDEVIFYAVVDDLSSRQQPAGLFRRTYTRGGRPSRRSIHPNLTWEIARATFCRAW